MKHLEDIRLVGHGIAGAFVAKQLGSFDGLARFAMLELLQSRFHIPSERMAVAGYAENGPSDPNGTEEGRAHDRRVDLVVLAAQGMKSEPPAAPGRSTAPRQ